MKVAFATLGCRVNSYEAEAMTEKFIKEGYEIVPFDEFADVYVINTCTVTNTGDKKSRQHINRAKKKNPNAIVAVVGCYSQIAPNEVAAIEGVDIVLGTRNKGKIVYYVNKVISDKEQIVEVNDVLKDKVFEELNISEYQDKTRAFLKIQDGCNRFCTYCLIPYARGAVCSKDPKTVIKEVKELASNNFKEIILSGIHIASYGSDLEGGWDLVAILEEISKIEGIERIRIGSIDPTFFTNGTIERMTKLKKLCPHFHLSLQSGCDATLKRMNRRYTTLGYKTIVNELRDKIKDVSITTDVIVGFPGETEEEFNKTYEFLKEIKLTKIHIFKYSPRKGTKAAEMKDDVHGSIKDTRSKLLQEIDEINESDFIDNFIDKELSVLFEEKIKDSDSLYEGYTTNYIRVICESNEDVCGEILNVKIKESKEKFAIGEIVI